MTDLPQPLTASEADLREFAFMPLDVLRLRDSDIAALSSGDEFRSAVLLWCASWHQVPAGSLPDDDKVLSQLAGFGRVVKEWQKIRDGALRNWIKCTDGRLYHPVVAEKANEAWAGRVKYAEKKEAERARKAEERRLKKLAEDGQIPLDITNLSDGQNTNVQRTGFGSPPDFALKETVDSGQWTVDSGQLTSKAGSSSASDPDYAGDDDRLPPRPLLDKTSPTSRAVDICTLLTGAGITKVTAFHPDVAVTWAQDERVTDMLLLAAVKRARETKGDQPIQITYLKPIIVELLNPPESKAKPKSDDWEWKRSDGGIERKGRELGMFARGGESHRDFAGRIDDEIRKRKGPKP